MKEFIIDSKKFVDIKPLFAGMDKCRPAHSYGPFVRRQYLIHFCLSGKGTLTDPRGTHRISRGELFVIRPGEVTTYSADRDDPWEYLWLGFDGTMSSIFSGGRSVYSFPQGIADRLRRAVDETDRNGHTYSAILHELIRCLFPLGEDTSDGVAAVKSYIDYNYMNDITVNEIAEAFGFERSYLYRIFKSRYGIGIKEYMIKIRMECAQGLLSEGFSVGICARLVGYKDEFNFSKAFKKHLGRSPSSFKPKKTTSTL